MYTYILQQIGCVTDGYYYVHSTAEEMMVIKKAIFQFVTFDILNNNVRFCHGAVILCKLCSC